VTPRLDAAYSSQKNVEFSLLYRLVVDTSRALQFAIDIAKVRYLFIASFSKTILSFDEGKVAGECELKHCHVVFGTPEMRSHFRNL
jgi:hypothetical protein